MLPTIVLVHDAFTESASWGRVIEPLGTLGDAAAVHVAA
jgi:hypothetical protein